MYYTPSKENNSSFAVRRSFFRINRQKRIKGQTIRLLGGRLDKDRGQEVSSLRNYRTIQDRRTMNSDSVFT